MKNNQDAAPLFNALVNYGLKSGATPFDVPGHKFGKAIPQAFKDAVGENIFKLDVNSMKELDSLSNPIGVIAEAEQLAAELFGAENAFFLVNGSTSGVQQMILSVCGDHDKLIMPRNAHKSTYNALVLSGAHPVYLEPHNDDESGVSMGVTLQSVKQALDMHPDAKALFLLHPTYFGYTQSLKAIIDLAHRRNVPVLVDQSHGSHFSLHEAFPPSAMALGADMATISMHKTGGSLTQSSILLHQGTRIKKSYVRSTINVFQTSSASYLLLASLDIARRQLALEGQKRFTTLLAQVNAVRSRIAALPGLEVLGTERLNGGSAFGFDPTKITVDVSAYGVSGFKAYDYFKANHNVQLELGESHVVLAVAAIGDDEEAFERLYQACKGFTNDFTLNHKTTPRKIGVHMPEMVYTPRNAFFLPSALVKLEQSEGLISADSIMVYPPGVPLVVPGERVTARTIQDYRFLEQEGNVLIGAHQRDDGIYINVLASA